MYKRQVVPGGELGVGHVEEVGATEECYQGVPGGDVGGRVLHVPIGGPTGDGHRSVGGHRQDEHQLLQVRAVVLAVSPLGGNGRLGAPGHPGGTGIDAGQLHRSGVVVQLGAVDAERSHRTCLLYTSRCV